MAIVDHFEPVREPGFRHGVDPQAARRQLNISIGLVAVLTIATVAVALSFRFEPQVLAARARAPVKLVVQVPQHVEVQQASVRTKQLPGG